MAKETGAMGRCPQCQRDLPERLLSTGAVTLPGTTGTRSLTFCPQCQERLSRNGVTFSQTLDQAKLNEAGTFLSEKRQRRRDAIAAVDANRRANLKASSK
jgi:hypothetical protein